MTNSFEYGLLLSVNNGTNLIDFKKYLSLWRGPNKNLYLNSVVNQYFTLGKEKRHNINKCYLKPFVSYISNKTV